MKISGEPVANLFASTSGSDTDWVVKLINVYPDEVAGDTVMGGYKLMIAANVFRGRSVVAWFGICNASPPRMCPPCRSTSSYAKHC
jgi:hypothetical protein